MANHILNLGIHNRKDLTKCHCGGAYKLMKPSPAERQQGKAPAVCSACNAFRYLQPREIR